MAGMIRIRRSLVESAADELDTVATELQMAHAPNGNWSEDDTEAKDAHEFLTGLVRRLREALA